MIQNALQVPDRFLAFAFGAGDILIELDQSLRIKSIDGATGLLDPQGSSDLTRLNLADLAAAAHQNEFAKLAKLNEKKSYRYGPVTLPLGVEPTRRNRFCVFVNKVLGEDRVFVTLSLESRLVRDAFGSDEALMANTTPDAFIDRVKKRLTEQTDDPAGVKLSVIEALNENLTSTAAAAVLRTLAEQSCDGGTAAQLSPGRFAVLHSAAPDAPDTHDLMAQAEVSSGVSLQGMSLGSGNTASVQPEIFLHTLKALVESGETTSFEDIAKSYDSLLQDNVEKAHAFRKIITDRKFTLRYQPIVSLKDRTIHHYEALSRFHKDIDFDGPGDAIGFAEQTGLIADYDLAVLKQAFKEIILAKGLKSPVKLAANISGYSLGKASFCDELLKLLK
ncbi:MAG: EAL domain-containing protein, partial [Pseudomonadota bacterium]